MHTAVHMQYMHKGVYILNVCMFIRCTHTCAHTCTVEHTAAYTLVHIHKGGVCTFTRSYILMCIQYTHKQLHTQPAWDTGVGGIAKSVPRVAM